MNIQLNGRLKSRKELATELNINRKTLYRWMKLFNIETNRNLLTPAEQRLLFERRGLIQRNER